MRPRERARARNSLVAWTIAALVAVAGLAGVPGRVSAGFLVGPFEPQDASYILPADATVGDGTGPLIAKAVDASGNVVSTAPSAFPRCRAFDAAKTVADFAVKVELPSAGAKVVSISDFGGSTTATDNSGAFQAALSACGDQPCTIRFAPGSYRFSQSIRVDGSKHLTIDGQGAKLTFGFRNNFAPMLTVRQSDHFQLKNVAFDWNWGVYRIATLTKTVAYEEKSGKSTWTFDTPDVPDFDLNTVYNWDSAYAIDGTTMTMGLPGVKDIWELPVSRVTKVSNSRIRLVLDGYLSDSYSVRPSVGSFWLLRHFGYEVHAVWVESCSHCTLDGVNIYSTPGMAITIGDDSQHIAIKNSRVGVFPGSARQISSATDGIHLAGTRGDILIENTEIANHGDDCVNVNDPVSVGFRVSDSKTIVAYDWRNGRIDYQPGDIVGFLNADYSDTGVNATIDAASYENAGWKIRFTTALQQFKNQTSKMFVINRSRYTARNVIIRGLHCHSNRARGVVLQAKNVVVEQSCFTNIQQEAICISSEIWLGHWAEGTGTVKAILDSNTIVRVDKQDTGRGAIYSGATYSDNLGLGAPVHSNLLVTNSIINGTNTRAFTMQMYDNVLIGSDTIVNVDANSANTGVIRVRRSSNVRINNNKWVYTKGVDAVAAGAKVQIETSSSVNVYGTGNLLVPLAELDSLLSATSALATTKSVAPATTALPATTSDTEPTPTEPPVESVDVTPTITLDEGATATATPTIHIDHPISTRTSESGFLNDIDKNPLAGVGTKITVESPIVVPTGTAKVANLIGARRA